MTFRDKRISWGIFAIALFSAMYFAQGGGPNQNSRFDLVRAIVENHTIAIDPFATNTIDEAKRGDHFYSDKAPGLSFASVVPYAIFHVVHSSMSPEAALYFVTIAIVGVAFAAGAALLFLLLRALAISELASLTATCACAFGSTIFAYAALYYAHTFVASLAIITFYLLHHAHYFEPKRPRFQIALAGSLISFAVIAEFPVAIIAVALTLYGARTLGIKKMIPFAIAAAMPLLVLAIYNARAFGSIASLGYSHLTGPRFQSSATFGLGMPKLDILIEILFGQWRGILRVSPFLIAAPFGFYWMIKSATMKKEGIVATSIVIAFLLMVSGYGVWDGGASMASRHLVPMIPFACIGVAFAFDRIASLEQGTRTLLTLGASLLVFASIAITTMSVAVMPEFPAQHLVPSPIVWHTNMTIDDPVTDFVFPMIEGGRVSEKAVLPNGAISFARMIPNHDDDAFNLGERLGIHGAWSLLPMLMVWGVGIFWIARTTPRRSTSTSTSKGRADRPRKKKKKSSRNKP
jgi:hypothetical protein